MMLSKSIFASGHPPQTWCNLPCASMHSKQLFTAGKHLHQKRSAALLTLGMKHLLRSCDSHSATSWASFSIELAGPFPYPTPHPNLLNKTSRFWKKEISHVCKQAHAQTNVHCCYHFRKYVQDEGIGIASLMKDFLGYRFRGLGMPALTESRCACLAIQRWNVTAGMQRWRDGVWCKYQAILVWVGSVLEWTENATGRLPTLSISWQRLCFFGLFTIVRKTAGAAVKVSGLPFSISFCTVCCTPCRRGQSLFIKLSFSVS